MFDISWTELLVIGVVALVVIGPKELPGTLRTLGQWMGKIRRMAAEFQGQFQDAMREAEIADLKKEMDEMAAKATNYGQFDPLEDVRKDVEKQFELPALDEPVTPPHPTSAAETGTATSALPPPAVEPAATEPAPMQTQASTQPAETDSTLDGLKPEPGRAPA